MDAQYYTANAPSALGGVKRLANAVGTDPRNWLKTQNAYTLHKDIRRKFRRRKYIVSGIDDTWQADLADMSMLAPYNEGFKYVLIVIDVFSKFVWIRHLKSKSATEVMAAFKMILLSQDRKPSKVMTDKGKEFDNDALRTYFSENNIHFYTSQNVETKAAIAERAIRTIKNRLYRFFTKQKSWKYLGFLQQIVNSYNNSYHRSIGMTPSDVSKENEDLVRRNLYPVRYNKRQKYKYAVGVTVRIAKEKPVFGKGYKQKWTDEIFTIGEQRDTDPPVYKLKALDGEVIVGTFYEPEIQEVEDTGVYNISEVIETRVVDGRKEHFVRWQGYPDSMNSWIIDSQIQNAN